MYYICAIVYYSLKFQLLCALRESFIVLTFYPKLGTQLEYLIEDDRKLQRRVYLNLNLRT